MHELNIDSFDKALNKEDIIEECMHENNLNIEFLYKANFKNAKILRDFIEVICKKYAFPPKLLPRMILVVDELNNNSIEYGSKEGEINKMRVAIIQEGTDVDFNIEVEDTGNGSHHKTSSEMNELKESKVAGGFSNHHSIRGRGLFLIIHKIVDDLYFNDGTSGGLIVGVQKKIPLN